MALEQELQRAVDAIVSRLRGGVEADVRALANDLVNRAAAEQRKAVDAARQAAESERATAAAKAAAQAREQAEADAEARFAAQAANIQQEAEAALTTVRQEAHAEIARVQQEAQAELARTQQEAAAERARAINAEVTKVRDEVTREAAAERARAIDVEVAKVRAEAERVLASSLAEAQAAGDQKAVAEARASAEQALADEIGRAREDGKKGQQAALAAVSRLLDAVRRLDAQPSLTSVLDTLTEVVASEAGRVAVFVSANGKMRGWRFSGFGPEVGEARQRVLNGPDAGFLSQALGERQTRVLAAGRREPTDRPPSFVALPDDRSALAVPVLVGGDAMVLVYADDVNTESRPILSQWSDAVELLARHAGHRLEALTADRAAALAPGVVPASPEAAAAAPAAAPAPSISESEDEEAARRYARLLVSEIKLYNEAAVMQGRAERDLGNRLKDEIDRARALYEERTPATVRSRSLFFDQELVRTLADGDPSLLGT